MSHSLIEALNNSSKSPRILSVNGKEITNLNEISNFLNDYFVSISKVNNPKRSNRFFKNSKFTNSFLKFKEVTPSKMKNIILSLKDNVSPGYD